ncbi:T-cell surface glycoprotein CD3 epsilon chain isoform X1 [Canis lupus baileyi]|uniref:T-cell surface glycoprotein CD3 epsilon chain n=2 Tax=Canis lupus TaxID=9612 RepID=CD3E_CANLF|nr:T-cell surface glycoprotein CD3 epsilon chain isoform X1 [Canis lupus dingo]XP_038364988.1 T-cell surface glycoprotein CD3 epsilon chain isoform X1 [Canis lupus familiaris]XP_038391928.1 T-cell surface glycoprotein CD3 epsilon chain isoform X1 [Canis lupus familiaris]P27597.1 RecName: Full=T-cell surface glycoprotein CD3 epsilon chain; AltName: CD_antigen=CD3e; Flags: Precursor [Canis lupus familiaris]AAA30834.1 CD3 epsilon [Canis lupus familiaris]|eukprot:NP_001003379.1 T-cell surface glycoprotein CD3 epsilon chain precursor [Canis lupus familiaris]
MQSRNLWRILGLCLLSVGAWGQDEDFKASDDLTSISPEKRFKVSISGTEVVVTCPDVFGYDNIKWEKNDNLVEGASNRELSQKEFSEVDDSGYYACYADSIKEKSYLYLRARVCANCIEVNLMAVVTIIVADICLTLGLLLMVYYWSKTRKANAKPVMRGTGAGSRPRGQNKEKPPPVPNPDYEPIRKGQQDLYSGLNQRGI